MMEYCIDSIYDGVVFRRILKTFSRVFINFELSIKDKSVIKMNRAKLIREVRSAV